MNLEEEINAIIAKGFSREQAMNIVSKSHPEPRSASQKVLVRVGSHTELLSAATLKRGKGEIIINDEEEIESIMSEGYNREQAIEVYLDRRNVNIPSKPMPSQVVPKVEHHSPPPLRLNSESDARIEFNNNGSSEEKELNRLMEQGYSFEDAFNMVSNRIKQTTKVIRRVGEDGVLSAAGTPRVEENDQRIAEDMQIAAMMQRGYTREDAIAAVNFQRQQALQRSRGISPVPSNADLKGMAAYGSQSDISPTREGSSRPVPRVQRVAASNSGANSPFDRSYDAFPPPAAIASRESSFNKQDYMTQEQIDAMFPRSDSEHYVHPIESIDFHASPNGSSSKEHSHRRLHSGGGSQEGVVPRVGASLHQEFAQERMDSFGSQQQYMGAPTAGQHSGNSHKGNSRRPSNESYDPQQQLQAQQQMRGGSMTAHQRRPSFERSQLLYAQQQMLQQAYPQQLQQQVPHAAPNGAVRRPSYTGDMLPMPPAGGGQLARRPSFEPDRPPLAQEPTRRPSRTEGYLSQQLLESRIEHGVGARHLNRSNSNASNSSSSSAASAACSAGMSNADQEAVRALMAQGFTEDQAIEDYERRRKELKQRSVKSGSSSVSHSISGSHSNSAANLNVLRSNSNSELLQRVGSNVAIPPPIDTRTYPIDRTKYSADEVARRMGILLSQQEAEYGFTMYDAISAEDEGEIHRLMDVEGVSSDNAVLMIFERRYPPKKCVDFSVTPSPHHSTAAAGGGGSGSHPTIPNAKDAAAVDKYHSSMFHRPAFLKKLIWKKKDPPAESAQQQHCQQQHVGEGQVDAQQQKALQKKLGYKEDDVRKLETLGFSRIQAVQALFECNNNVKEAAAMLVNCTGTSTHHHSSKEGSKAQSILLAADKHSSSNSHR